MFPLLTPRRPTGRASTGKRLLIALFLFALTLRALVPAGYMPDADAALQRQLALTLCHMGGTLPGEPLRTWDAAGQDDTSDQAANTLGCPFGLHVYAAILPDLPVVVPVRTAVYLPTASSSPAPIVRRTSGPPLGSRAPPSPLPVPV